MDDEQKDPSPGSSKKRKIHKQEHRKQIWLITYAASSVDIKPEMLHENGIECDECYSIQWRESKYTLIHLKQEDKVRSSTLDKVMRKLDTQYGIKQSTIVGYEALASNNKADTLISQHPGFKRMVYLLNQKDPELKAWMESGDVATNKKGIFWKFIETTDPKLMSRNQLEKRVAEWAPIVQESTSLRSMNETLKITLEIREKELQESQARNRKLFNDLSAKMDECTALKQRLIQCNQDHTWSRDSAH